MTIYVWDTDYLKFSAPLQEMLEVAATYGEGRTKRHHNILSASGVETNFRYLPNLLSYIERAQNIHFLLSELQRLKIEIELDEIFEDYNQNIPQMFKILLLFNKWYPTECKAMFPSWSDRFEEKLIHILKLLVNNYQENDDKDPKNWENVAEMFFCFRPENFPIVSEILKDLKLGILRKIYPQQIINNHFNLDITIARVVSPKAFFSAINRPPINQVPIRTVELEYNFLFANRHELFSYTSSGIKRIYGELNDKTRLEMIGLILLLPKFNNIDNCPIPLLANVKELLRGKNDDQANIHLDYEDWKWTAKKILFNYSNPVGGIECFWGLARTHREEACLLHERIKSLEDVNLEDFLQEINDTITVLYDNGSIGHYLIALILIKSVILRVWDQDKRTTLTNQMPVKPNMTSCS